MSIPRRGYFAAGLALAVAGSMGFALNADADEVADAPAPAAAEAPAAPAPPALLPWGERPKRAKVGPVGATSKQLADMGADIAPARKTGQLRRESVPKGRFPSNRKPRSGRTAVAPQPPLSAQAAKAPVDEKVVRYHYSAAEQKIESEGTYANLVIAGPKLGAKDYHTLGEIAVLSADERQAVEVGWTVDRNLYGNDDPHLFVYWWKDSKGQGYDGFGYVPYEPAEAEAGGTLVDDLDTVIKMGIQFTGDAWWIAVGSEWIGYFPASLWEGRFKQAGWNKWFGEVASPSVNPCSQMGTGFPASNEARAARMGTIGLIGPNKDRLSIELKNTSNYYDENGVEQKRPGGPAYSAVRSSYRTLRYGGEVPKLADGTDNPDC